MKKEQTKYIIVIKDKYGFKSHKITTKERLLDNLIFCKEKLAELWVELPEVDILKKCILKDLAEYYYKNDEIIYISQLED
jgi:hypothetical protein